ncbi:hypothetical protein NLD30_01755 [SCandidatus Aminicenantes bacterium Aminicenantia_JdfR_composite]|jgi:hypothetical protein|nr:hypothetical protein [SCandidatus Aminicenantes bacterium Aminicenantia_JdfR_composite]MCP2596242.1 hypothetical protein [Candidatus Aminicenantes bacterium AC-335-G13]MCP2597817.1 hypothetical protein [Candidatus Aminicenantes bacterium AC-335-L06]MCP2606153.1 hypothetical protein [Candidatus Aminicenantes bacterium AC-708-I09]
MKKIKWQIVLGVFLVSLSAVLYLIHYSIFRDPHHIFIYMLGDIAFVPIEVLFVTLIIHKVISEREKHVMMEKLNMVIGTFFSEVGTKLLKYFSKFDQNFEEMRNRLIVENDWSEKDFLKIKKLIFDFNYSIDSGKGNLEELKKFLIEKWNFLLRLLENPNLLEHESFTELLWAVFHLAGELANRDNVQKLSETDYEHLSNDIKRAYILLISQWLDYMKHLKNRYPYLFSLAIRINPFKKEASAEIK